MMFVAVYSVSRNYGGPEEGGWWFDWYDYEHTIGGPLPEGDAFAIARDMNDRTDNRDRYGRTRFQVNGGPDIVFMAEDVAGEFQSGERPRYE